MSNYTKIIALTIGKKKGFRILLAAEIFLLLVGIVSLFGRNAIYEYSMEYVSKESDTPGYVVEFEDISLPKRCLSGTVALYNRHRFDEFMHSGGYIRCSRNCVYQWSEIVFRSDADGFYHVAVKFIQDNGACVV